MPLPTWEKFMIPVLENSSQEIKVLDLADICAKKFNLTDEEMDEGYDKERVSSLDQFLEDNEIDR